MLELNELRGKSRYSYSWDRNDSWKHGPSTHHSLEINVSIYSVNTIKVIKRNSDDE